jgi:hypothetical protein
MAIHVTPIPSLTTFSAPSFTLGTSNAAGDSGAAVASNSTLLAFDAVAPVNVAPSTAVVGTAVVSSRRDHAHVGVTAADSGLAKSWCRILSDASLVTGSYNVASISSGGTGQRTVNFTTDFANTNYVVQAVCDWDGTFQCAVYVHAYAVGSVAVNTYNSGTVALANAGEMFMAMGAQ